MNFNRKIVSSDEEPEYDSDEEPEHNSDEETLSDDGEHAPISSWKKNDNSKTYADSEENENKKTSILSYRLMTTHQFRQLQVKLNK